MRQVPKLKESGMSRFGLALYVSFHQTMRTTRNQMVGQRKAQSAQTPEQEPEQTPAQPEAQALQASQEGEMPNSFPLYLPYNRDLY